MRLSEKVKELTNEFAAATKMKKSQRVEMNRCAESSSFINNRAERFYKEWSADQTIVLEEWMKIELTNHLEFC